jgi:hypothetical protein
MILLYRQFAKHIERYTDESQPLLFEGGEQSAPEPPPRNKKDKEIITYERKPAKDCRGYKNYILQKKD